MVRWRYPGEDWQQLEADDYTIEDLPGQCCNSYEVTVSYEIANCKGGIANSGIGKVRIPNAIYQGVDYKLTTGFSRTQIVVKYFDCIQNRNKEKPVWGSSGKSDPGVSCTDKYAIYSQGSSKWELVDLIRVDGQPDECKTCIFTVYKDGAIVHQEERKNCPEAEKVSCHLSNISKKIKVDKIGCLEGIEVVNFARDGLFPQKEIPQHCLNIYLTFIQSSIIPIFGIYGDYKFIAQICSAPTCPPPEYEVICDCDCQKCPPGTCTIECDGHICCYDRETGKPVLEIAIEDFCES